MGWNAKQYLKFEAERTQPAIDLIARLDGLAPGAFSTSAAARATAPPFWLAASPKPL